MKSDDIEREIQRMIENRGGGMRLPTWEETEQDLIKIQQAFVSLHNTGEKNWTPEEKQTAYQLRKRCVKLGEYRYSLIRKQQ